MIDEKKDKKAKKDKKKKKDGDLESDKDDSVSEDDEEITWESRRICKYFLHLIFLA